jgi:hypothetical protein
MRDKRTQPHMDYLWNKPRRWKVRLGPVILPIWSRGESSLSRTQFRCFRLAFHSFSFLLCSSRQPYNAREFSNLWLGIGAPTRSAPCAAAQAAHPWNRPCMQQADRSCSSTVDMCVWGSAWFEYPLWYWISYQRFLMFYSVPPKKCRNSISISSQPLPSKSFPIHYH